MSSTRQAVILSPSFTSFGKRPDLTPAHQHDRLTGIIAGIGGVAVLSPKICFRRKKPVFGISCTIIRSCAVTYEPIYVGVRG